MAESNTPQSVLDSISAEVAALSEEELAAAAAAIVARQQRAKERMTPDKIQHMKDREKRRRLTNSAILKLAKAKGIVPDPKAAPVATEGTVEQPGA